MNDNIIIALITLLGTTFGVIGGYIGRSRKTAVQEAKREQEQSDLFDKIIDEMKEVKKKLDQHNHYAEKFGEIEKAIISIRKDIEYIRKEKNEQKAKN